jgi:hypothetical protein
MIRSAVTTMFAAAMQFVVDLNSLIQDTGRQIDWSYAGFSEKFRRGSFKVKLAEDVSIGETAVTVDALEAGLKKGDTLDFGTVASVVVVVGAAGAAQGATSVPVDALTGPLPSGALLDFGTNKFARLTANAAAAATSLAVSALATALVDDDTATYQGGDRILRLADDAEKDDTAITVEPPNFFVADNSEAWAISRLHEGQNRDAFFIPAGTVCVEVDPGTNNKIVPLSIHTDGLSATGQVMVLLTDAKNDSKTDSLTGYGVTFAGVFYEQRMPDAIENGGTMPTGWKTFLGSRYVWKKYYDSRGA